MATLSSSSGGPDLVDFLHATVLSPKGLLSLVVSIVVIMLVVCRPSLFHFYRTSSH